MSTPAVLIIANPFEARAVSRAVEAAGLRPVVCEGGEGAEQSLRGEVPSALVLARGLCFVDDEEVHAAIRARAAGVPLLLLAEEGDGAELALSVTARVPRPIDVAELERQLRGLARSGEPSGPWLVTPSAVDEEGDEAEAEATEALPAGGAAGEHWLSPPEEPLFARPARVRSPGPDADDDEAEERGEEDVGGDGAPPGAQAGEPSLASPDGAAAGVVKDEAWWESEPASAGDVRDEETASVAAGAGARRAMLRLDEAVEGELIVKRPTLSIEPRSAAPVPLEDRVASVERQLRRSEETAAPRRGEERAAGASDLLAIDALPGLDAALGPLGIGRPAPSRTEGSPAGDAPPKKADLIGQALAMLVPGRNAALSRGTIRDAQATPELEEGSAVADLPDAGELSKESVAELVTRLHRAGFTGRLALRRGEADKSIFFDGGFPVHATSSLPYDRLAELLWREGKITRDQHAQGRQFPGGGRRAIEFLVEIGALKRDETFKVMRHLVEEIIYSCFAWDRGGWSIGRDAAARDDKVSVSHPYALVLEGIRRKYPLERLVQAVGPSSTVVGGSQTLWRVSADAGLSPMEREAVSVLRRGPKTVQELRVAGRIDEIGAYAVVHGLLLLGALARTEGAGALDADPRGADEAAVDRDRALAKYAQVVDGDYFAVLGVSRNASAYEIRRAWERTRADFAPERFEREVRDELAERLAEIRDVVDEACRALSDDGLRDAYRSHLALP